MNVAIFMGSKSNAAGLKPAADCLAEFGIAYQAHILSAHRVPEVLVQTLEDCERNGTECIIAAAGLAAHLPGVIAAHTTLPVIGVPMADAIGGLDSLYSMVQMPKPIPVATVGLGNAYNAAMLAVEILAVKYPQIKEQLRQFRQDMKRSYLEQNQGDPFQGDSF
ncbi:5-(carboxyamino)imidazole ribonucleotide mutase [Candidatus Haliotispira prima]|uniref:N5-carboxyaminoimidazole ribonucleotide mutase n=1 Tax=Candidatus Haliotispira prima TaxID=3034016 RepID=A0ABY8MII6_9SPIO|nr:5-(carboxyamino)imidazole ribonucleotide mutase [Candidatus Haliotispira prima]